MMCLLFEILRQGVNALSNGEWKYSDDRPSQSRSRMAVWESDSALSRDEVTRDQSSRVCTWRDWDWDCASDAARGPEQASCALEKQGDK